MQARELYLCLYQCVCHENGDAPIQNVSDFDRPLEVYVAKNSNQSLASVSLAFVGLTSRFHCVLSFDGTADASIGIEGFFMPRVRLNARQRTLGLMSCLKFLIEAGVIVADWHVVQERIGVEFGKGSIGIFHQFARQLERATNKAGESTAQHHGRAYSLDADQKVFQFI